MQELQITHVRKSGGVITHVKIASSTTTYTTDSIIESIALKKFSFYTLENGIKANVQAILTTSPDGSKANNLDSLDPF